MHASKYESLRGSGLFLRSLRLIVMPFWGQIYGPQNSAD